MNVGLHFYLDIIQSLSRHTAKYDIGFNQVHILATPVICPFDDFNENWKVSENFNKNTKFEKIRGKSFRGELTVALRKLLC